MDQAAIVFGGAGFIGRNLLTVLAARGFKSMCVDLRPLQPPIPGCTPVIRDVRAPLTELTEAIPAEFGPENTTVYNLAAVHRTPGHKDREYYDTNVFGAINVTELCRVRGYRKLVFTSSISVYGPSESERSETSEPRPESAYGASKLQSEAVHQGWQREDRRRRLVIVRPAVIFGPGEQGNFTRLAKALRQRRFVYPGRRDTIKACGYVDDLIESIFFANSLERECFVYNFCYPKPYTIEDICETFHRVGRLPRPVATLPLRPLWFAAAMFESLSRAGFPTDVNRARVYKLVRSTRIRPQALADAGFSFSSDLDAGIARWRERSNGEFV